jgi:lysozyme
MDMRLSERGLALIAYYEASVSLRLSDGSVPYPGGYDNIPEKYLTVYMDTLATRPVPTVGLGTTSYDIDGLQEGQVYSQTDVLEMFRTTIGKYERAVLQAVDKPLTQNQFDALVSFVYNCGAQAFRDSTMLKRINSDSPALAAAEFERWNKAGGVVRAGLIARRKAEAELFRTKQPQARANISESRTVRAAGAMTVVGAVTAVAPAIGPLDQMATFVENHLWIAAVGVACVGIYLIAVRWDDWRRGKR